MRKFILIFILFLTMPIMAKSEKKPTKFNRFKILLLTIIDTANDIMRTPAYKPDLYPYSIYNSNY